MVEYSFRTGHSVTGTRTRDRVRRLTQLYFRWHFVPHGHTGEFISETGGQCSAATSSIALMACPELYPSAGEPFTLMAVNMLKR